MKTLSEFTKSKDFLICVDSDGCAMDTMNIKHLRCFGPLLVEQWGLQLWREPILARWNEVNLYSMTRGINRFLGLGILLEEINETYTSIEGAKEFAQWARSAQELSNATVLAMAKKSEQKIFKEAWSWSEAVNTAITKLPVSEKVPFAGVQQSLVFAKEFADVCIISAANPEAVIEEWTQHNLIQYVDVSLAQDIGPKEYCISRMLEFGYDLNKVVMVGDAPGDLMAAQENHILFYPILVRHETSSWKDFQSLLSPRLLDGTYLEKHQQTMIDCFIDNLS